MIPFNDFFGALRTMLGNGNAKLINKLTKVSNARPTKDTPDAFRRRNSIALFEAAMFSGGAKLCYDRIDLEQFLGRDLLYVTTRETPLKVHDAIHLINRKFRLELKIEDIYNNDIIWTGTPATGTFLLEANADSIGLAGKVAMELRPGPDVISEIALNTNLGLALYPSGQNTKGQAQFISYPCDTSAFNAELSSWRTGDAITTPILETLRSITNKDWTFAAGDYSLLGASINYAGLVRPGIDIGKTNYTRVVTVLLSDQCANFAGELVLYHNPN